MPWDTPTLKEVRSLVRDNVRASLPGADANVPNSVLRVLSDAQGGLCHLNLQYIDWLSLQLLPDTSETEWLDRHADIWLVNADGTIGRKQATFASGSVMLTGVIGTVVPTGTRLQGVAEYETTATISIGAQPSEVTARALDPGVAGNLDQGDTLTLDATAVGGASGVATVVTMEGGVDTENDDDLRRRVLFRIQQPPMGGDANDYVAWAMAVPGVTRAWCSPLEMGMGTVTVRFMMDELRADNDGFPLAEDIEVVADYLDTVRPVAVKDFFVVAPIPEPIDFTITGLNDDGAAVRAAIEQSVTDLLTRVAAPAHAVNGVAQGAQTIFAAWVSEAILSSQGVEEFTLVMTDHYMPSPGHMGVLGSIHYGPG